MSQDVMNPRLKHVGLSLARQPCCLRDVRLHDSSPTKNTNVPGSDRIRMASAATRYAAKGCLIGAIGLVNMAARWTCSRGISRIDQSDGYARKRGLVCDTGLQLKERPAMQNGALRLPSPHPRANVLEVFKRNPPLCALSLPNNAFADRMVDILCEARFLSRQFLESPLRRQGSLLLELVSEPPVPIANTFDGTAAVNRAIAISGDVRHTQIDPKHVVNILWIGFVYLTGRQQIPVAAMVDQIGFTHPRVEQPHLALTSDEGDRQPPFQCPDRHRRFKQVPRENAVIVGNSGKRTKGALCLLAEFVGIAYFRKRADDDLCRQSKYFSHMWVAQLLERKLAKCLRFPGDSADVVAGGVGRLKYMPKGISLLRRRQQLQLCDQFHILNCRTKERHMQPQSAAFLPGLKHLGFLRLFL
jgi:hypothetical protein